MVLLRQLFKFFELLHSETSPHQLCAGFVVGMFMGFLPASNLLWLGMVMTLFLFRVNIAAALLSYALFLMVSFFLDPAFDKLGLAILTQAGLKPLWVTFYNAPLIPFTRFNNTIVMGGLAISLILAVPLFFISRTLILNYREVVVRRFRASIVWRTWTATKLYRLYARYLQFKSA